MQWVHWCTSYSAVNDFSDPSSGSSFGIIQNCVTCSGVNSGSRQQALLDMNDFLCCGPGLWHLSAIHPSLFCHPLQVAAILPLPKPLEYPPSFLSFLSYLGTATHTLVPDDPLGTHTHSPKPNFGCPPGRAYRARKVTGLGGCWQGRRKLKGASLETPSVAESLRWAWLRS